MLLDESEPGYGTGVRRKLCMPASDESAAKKVALDYFNSICGDVFKFENFEVFRGKLRDHDGKITEEDWYAKAIFYANEKVLKRHEELLSKRLNLKMKVTRFKRNEWYALSAAEQITAIKNLSSNICKPKIYKIMPYNYNQEEKVAVFFYYE